MSLPMKRKMPLLTAIAVMVGLGSYWLVSTSRAATETPVYSVIRKDGKVEIRDYPALTVAMTSMEGDEMNQSFGQLFRFITGGNASGEKISMTSPVLIDTAKQKKTMRFIMPQKAVDKGVPKPVGDRVVLEKMKAARFAVLRFDGARTADNETAAIEKLESWLKAENIEATGTPIFAYYDPPWTPVFLRRNEVMIPIPAVVASDPH